MIFLISGTSHTGKTYLAQQLLEKYHYPYLSIDHLKMGLIRSHQTDLTPMSDDQKLIDYLWPIIKEIIKTAIENNQHMIIEGCYIPMDFKKDFDKDYLKHIKLVCLIMSENYIKNHFDDIKQYANVIENRLDNELDMNDLIQDNINNLVLAKQNKIEYILIDDEYPIDFNQL